MPRKNRSTKKKMDQIDSFFAEYPTFDYRRTASSCKEFYRMCNHFDWNKDHHGNYPPARVEAYEAFREAMVGCFNDRFGTDVTDRKAWESICAVLGVEPIPASVEEMKEVVKNTHVNLSDLLDGGRSGAEVQIFDTEEELAAYTISEGRFFPKEEAYAGGVLRFLLREILATYEGQNGRGGGKRNRGRGRGRGRR